MPFTRPAAVISLMQFSMTFSGVLPLMFLDWMKSTPISSTFQAAQPDSSWKRSSSSLTSISLQYWILSIGRSLLVSEVLPVDQILQRHLGSRVFTFFRGPAEGDVGDHFVLSHARGDL